MHGQTNIKFSRGLFQVKSKHMLREVQVNNNSHSQYMSLPKFDATGSLMCNTFLSTLLDQWTRNGNGVDGGFPLSQGNERSP